MNRKGVVFVSTYHEPEAHGRSRTHWIIVAAFVLALSGGGGSGAPGY